jgi:hypothetical protein
MHVGRLVRLMAVEVYPVGSRAEDGWHLALEPTASARARLPPSVGSPAHAGATSNELRRS